MLPCIVAEIISGVDLSNQAQKQIVESLKDTFHQRGDIRLKVRIFTTMAPRQEKEVPEITFVVTRVPVLLSEHVKCTLHALIQMAVRQRLHSVKIV